MEEARLDRAAQEGQEDCVTPESWPRGWVWRVRDLVSHAGTSVGGRREDSASGAMGGKTINIGHH